MMNVMPCAGETGCGQGDSILHTASRSRAISVAYTTWPTAARITVYWF